MPNLGFLRNLKYFTQSGTLINPQTLSSAEYTRTPSALSKTPQRHLLSTHAHVRTSTISHLSHLTDAIFPLSSSSHPFEPAEIVSLSHPSHKIQSPSPSKLCPPPTWHSQSSSVRRYSEYHWVPAFLFCCVTRYPTTNQINPKLSKFALTTAMSQTLPYLGHMAVKLKSLLLYMGVMGLWLADFSTNGLRGLHYLAKAIGDLDAFPMLKHLIKG